MRTSLSPPKPGFLYLVLTVAVFLLLIPHVRAFAASQVMALSLNEGAGPTYNDTSGKGNNGTCSGSTCPAGGTGAVGTGGVFDGAGDYIAVTGSSTLKPASTVAVSAFIKASVAPANGGEIVSMGDSYVLRLLADGNVRFFFYNGSSWMVVDTTAVNVLDNTFHHLVGQKSSSILEIYVDGVQRASTTASGTISYTLGPNLNIGRHGNGDPTRYFNGTIDQVTVYDSPLTPVEIATRMTLRLNEAAGAVTFGDASIGNNGSCSGTTCPVSGSAGAVNTAALFDGSNDFINVPGDDSLRPPNTVAVSAWVKATTEPANGGEIVSMGDNYAIRLLGNGNVRFLFYSGNNTWASVDTLGVSVLGGSFHHVVGQKTGTTVEVYVDGVLRGQTPTNAAIVYGLGTNLNVGRHANNDPTRYFNGTIDEVNVFSRSLTTAEISSLYGGDGVRTDKDTVIPLNSGLTPPATRGSKFSDSNFPGVQLLRVTDSSDGNDCHHDYSYLPALNSDNTRILYNCDNVVYFQNFDPATQTYVGAKQQAVTNGSPGASVLWSPVNPNIIVYPLGARLYWKDVSTGAFGVERDFAADMGSGRIVWQLSRSEDNDIWAFMKAVSSDPLPDSGHKGYIVWKRSTNQVLLNVDLDTFDEVKIDKTGRYLWINLGDDIPRNRLIDVRDLQTGSVTPLVFDSQGTNRPPGHYDLGTGTVVGADGWESLPGVTYRSLATPQSYTRIITFGDWNCAEHFSMIANNEAWALVSMQDANGVSTSPALKNEIFQVATDVSGGVHVRRIAHHHSQYTNFDYWSTPRATISKDGKFVVWTSQWHGGKRDVYMAMIPPAP